MGPLTTDEYSNVLKASDLNRKYKDAVNPQSAFEMLENRMKETKEKEEAEDIRQGKEREATRSSASKRQEKSTFDQVLSSPVAKQVGRELIRGVFGVLFGKTSRTASRIRRGIF
jgi:hypothetical protein